MDQVLLGSLRDSGLRLRSTITVKVDREGERVLCEAVEVNEFGFGKTLSEALTDLRRTISELYLMLEKERGDSPQTCKLGGLR